MSFPNERSFSPFAVICSQHGQVFLTEEEYDAQMAKPQQQWFCPLDCRVSRFDEANLEHFRDQGYPCLSVSELLAAHGLDEVIEHHPHGKIPQAVTHGYPHKT